MCFRIFEKRAPPKCGLIKFMLGSTYSGRLFSSALLARSDGLFREIDRISATASPTYNEPFNRHRG